MNSESQLSNTARTVIPLQIYQNCQWEKTHVLMAMAFLGGKREGENSKLYFLENLMVFCKNKSLYILVHKLNSLSYF